MPSRCTMNNEISIWVIHGFRWKFKGTILRLTPVHHQSVYLIMWSDHVPWWYIWSCALNLSSSDISDHVRWWSVWSHAHHLMTCIWAYYVWSYAQHLICLIMCSEDAHSLVSNLVSPNCSLLSSSLSLLLSTIHMLTLCRVGQACVSYASDTQSYSRGLDSFLYSADRPIVPRS